MAVIWNEDAEQRPEDESYRLLFIVVQLVLIIAAVVALAVVYFRG